MQNQSIPSGPTFNLVPMVPQQFYQLAQHHANVNANFAPIAPTYMPLHDSSEAYSTMPSGNYSVPPQHMVHPSPYDSYDNGGYWSMPSMGSHPASVYEAVPHYGSVHAYDPVLASGHSHAHQMSAPVHSHHAHCSHASSSAPSALPLPTTVTSVAVPVANSNDQNASEIISDAPVADEHKWRKYGQKQVKRSPYPRNYYKCTVSGCPAKKHLEKFWEPSLNRERCRTIYLGEHVHPVAVSPQVFATNQLDFQNNVLAQSAKIRSSVDVTSASSIADLASQQRLVVECGTHVDENEDGYSWRKYGQKSVKGSVTPRQYYRCRIAGCPVKKTVEASLKGNTIVTYDGCHSHEPGAFCATESRPESPESLHLYNHHHQLTAYNLAATAYYSPSTTATVSSPASTSVTSPVSTPHSPSTRGSFVSDVYASIHSPVSSYSTEDDDSCLSEPATKRSMKDEDVTAYSDVSHAFVPGMPSADVWYGSWDGELLTH